MTPAAPRPFGVGEQFAGGFGAAGVHLLGVEHALFLLSLQLSHALLIKRHVQRGTILFKLGATAAQNGDQQKTQGHQEQQACSEPEINHSWFYPTVGRGARAPRQKACPGCQLRCTRRRRTITAMITKPPSSSAGGAEPEQRGLGVESRFVADEITVAVDHEVDDLLVVLALAEHAENLFAQVGGDRCVGVGDVLVLALGATQFFGQLAKTLAVALFGELVGVDGGVGHTSHAQPQTAAASQRFMAWPHRPAPDTWPPVFHARPVVDHPDELVADDALGVDEEGFRRAVHAEVQAQGAGIVTDIQLIRVVELGQPLQGVGVDVLVVDAVDHHALLASLFSTGCSTRQEMHQVPQTLTRPVYPGGRRGSGSCRPATTAAKTPGTACRSSPTAARAGSRYDRDYRTPATARKIASGNRNQLTRLMQWLLVMPQSLHARGFFTLTR